MFKDQVPYSVGETVYIEFLTSGAKKVIIEAIEERKNMFGKKRYKYLVENACNLNRNDYLRVYHEEIIYS